MNDPRQLEYTAVYYSIEDGWFLAEVLDFPGTVSQRRSLKSARRMIRDALRQMADCRLERGKALPTPNPDAGDPKAVVQERIPLTMTHFLAKETR